MPVGKRATPPHSMQPGGLVACSQRGLAKGQRRETVRCQLPGLGQQKTADGFTRPHHHLKKPKLEYYL